MSAYPLVASRSRGDPALAVRGKAADRFQTGFAQFLDGHGECHVPGDRVVVAWRPSASVPTSFRWRPTLPTAQQTPSGTEATCSVSATCCSSPASEHATPSTSPTARTPARSSPRHKEPRDGIGPRSSARCRRRCPGRGGVHDRVSPTEFAGALGRHRTVQLRPQSRSGPYREPAVSGRG